MCSRLSFLLLPYTVTVTVLDYVVQLPARIRWGGGGGGGGQAVNLVRFEYIRRILPAMFANKYSPN